MLKMAGRVMPATAIAVALMWGTVGVSSAQSRCATLGGAENAGVCTIHAVKPNYRFDATYPVNYADEQALTDYVAQTRDGFVNVAQMPDSAYGSPYQLDMKSTDYRSGVAPRGTQSVAFEVYQNVGGAHPQTFYKAFNINVETRRPITFDDLWLPGTKPLDVLFPLVVRELEKETKLTGMISPGAGLDPSRYQNFAITDADLLFFFGQEELLPSSAGANVVRIPRAALTSVLAPLPPPPAPAPAPR